MSGRTLTNVVNDQTIALNAMIYGYAGHSLVTPHAALQQIWWTDERINEKVTQEFVTSRLQPRERERLTQSVGFGDLSDDTYIEWILEKARRLFLVLAEIGEDGNGTTFFSRNLVAEGPRLRIDCEAAPSEQKTPLRRHPSNVIGVNDD